MKKKLFDELLDSVREGGAILRGEQEPSRSFRVEDLCPRSTVDPIVAEVRRVREALFAEAEYDIYEFCRRLSDQQETSGHSIVNRGDVTRKDSEEEAVHPPSETKLG